MWTVLKANAIAVALAGLVYGGSTAVVPERDYLEILFGPVERQSVDFQTLEIRGSDNEFLMCSERYCTASEPHAASPVIPLPLKVVRGRFFEVLALRPKIRLLSIDALADQYVVEERSKVFGFPDTVTIRFFALDDDHTTVAIYSRSHYGESDLGVNEQRVRAWIDYMSRGPAG